MLNLAVRNTRKLVRRKVGEENLRIGRYFTKKGQAARLAASLTLPKKETVWVLDAGAGTGILAAAVIDRLVKESVAKEIYLDCYETNEEFLPVLSNNLERIRKKILHDYKVRLRYTVKAENYILAQGKMTPDDPRVAMLDKTYYDIAVSNPPRELIKTDREEYTITRRLCSGDTDACYLFAAALSASLLPGGEAAMLLPIVFSTGAYMEKIRRYIFERTCLTGVHLFLSNTQKDETRGNMILSLRNTEDAPEAVRITSSYGEDEECTGDVVRAYDAVVKREDYSLLLLKNEEEEKLLSLFAKFPESFSSLGLRMKTGITLPSRYPDMIVTQAGNGVVPLLHPANIRGGIVEIPSRRAVQQYVIPEVPSLLQRNKNMLLVKRVPAKSDKKMLCCGAYFAAQMPMSKVISTHNKLNYIDYEDEREMDPAMLYGLFAMLNSTLYGQYYAIRSKSKQINASEFTDMPLLSPAALRQMGQKLAMTRVFSEKACDALFVAQIKSGKL